MEAFFFAAACAAYGALITIPGYSYVYTVSIRFIGFIGDWGRDYGFAIGGWNVVIIPAAKITIGDIGIFHGYLVNEPVTSLAFVGDGDQGIGTIYFVGTFAIDGCTGTGTTDYAVDVLSGAIIFVGAGGGTTTGTFGGGSTGRGIEGGFFYFYFEAGFYFVFEAIGAQFVGEIGTVYIDYDGFGAIFEITYRQVPVHAFGTRYTYAILSAGYLSIGLFYYAGSEEGAELGDATVELAIVGYGSCVA